MNTKLVTVRGERLSDAALRAAIDEAGYAEPAERTRVGIQKPAAVTSAQSENGPAYGYLADKAGLLNRLRRIEGQVRGIERMVDEERYCIEILTQ